MGILRGNTVALSSRPCQDRAEWAGAQKCCAKFESWELKEKVKWMFITDFLSPSHKTIKNHLSFLKNLFHWFLVDYVNRIKFKWEKTPTCKVWVMPLFHWKSNSPHLSVMSLSLQMIDNLKLVRITKICILRLIIKSLYLNPLVRILHHYLYYIFLQSWKLWMI